MGLTNIGSTWCSSATGSTTIFDVEGHSEEFCWLHHYAEATTTSVPDAISSILKLCHGSSTVEFTLLEFGLPTIHILYIVVCYRVCFLLSGSSVPTIFTNGSSTIGVWITAALQSIPLADICASWLVCGPCHECTEWLLSMLLLGGLHVTYSVGPQPFHQYSGARSFKGWAEGDQIHPHYLYSGKGSFFHVVFHPMTCLTLNLWWAVNLVILVW